MQIKPIRNKYGSYEYRGMKITRTGDKRFPWGVSTGHRTTDRYEFHVIADAACFIDRVLDK